MSLSLPDPLEIATAVGLTATSCAEESKLKSGNGPATQVSFRNSSEGRINVYWLDHSGKRVSYKQGLAAGATHEQQTFVSHPWVITNDQDQCLGIYTPTDTRNVSLDVKKTVTVSGAASHAGTCGAKKKPLPPTSSALTGRRVQRPSKYASQSPCRNQ